MLHLFSFLLFIYPTYAENGIITFYSNVNNACQYDPDLYQDFLKVAISGTNWRNSIACGTCLSITGSGTGIGTTPFLNEHNAIVTNLCSECEENHYDLLLDGNGIWDISYQIIPCKNVGNIKYRTESDNPFFFKLQLINTETPIIQMFLEGHMCEKTFDNFWVHHDPTILGGDIFSYPLNIQFMEESGQTHYGTIHSTTSWFDLIF